MERTLKLIALALLVAVAAAACGRSDMATSTTSVVDVIDFDETTPEGSLVATAKVPGVEIFASPEAPTADAALEANPDYPMVFAVIDRTESMVQVMLPHRPNGSTGWVPTGQVDLSYTTFRIEIDLSDHRLTLLDVSRDDPVVMAATVAVGTEENPTPIGSFYVFELLQPDDAGGAYGPYAFGLSGHSDTLTEYAGGDGRIGIHGTNQPELLGADVSHGCARVSNDSITQLAELVPLGTRVEIVA